MITYFLFHSVCLLLFWTFYQVFLKRDTFFERNRWYLLGSLAASLLVPILQLPLVEQVVRNGDFPDFVLLPTLEVRASSLFRILSEENIKNSLSIDWQNIILIIYWTGFMLMLCLFAVRLGKLLLYFKRLLVVADPNSVGKVVVENKEITTIQSNNTFSFLNYLFWNKSLNLSKKEEQQILAHELAHIKGGHSYDLLFLQLQKIVFWFNPLIYLYENELRNQHEFIADQTAIKLSNTEDYVSLMVSSFFKTLQIDLVHSFYNQQIKQRIKMLNTQKTSWIKGNAKTVLAVALVALVAFAVACTNALTSIEKDRKLSEVQVAQNKNNIELTDLYMKELNELMTKYPSWEVSKISVDKQELANLMFKNVNNVKDHERMVFLYKEIFASKKYDLKLSGADNDTNQEEVFTETDQMASPIGGLPEMYKAIAKEMRYPQEARENGIQGKVFIQFIVNTDGSLSNIEVVKGFDETNIKLDEMVVVGYKGKSEAEKKEIAENIANSLNEEAKRAIALAKWTPAEQNGKKVRQRLVMPINFMLD